MSHHVGTSFQPGKGPISIFQPVSEEGSRTPRRLVSDFSFANSSTWGNVWSGGSERSGIGQRRIVPSSQPDAIHRPSGETATLMTGPMWPKSRWGSSEQVGLLAADWPDAHDAVLVPGHEGGAKK
jgi:hypothetical protein